MNQILITETIIVTPELRKKKNVLKKLFLVSTFLVILLFSYYIYAESDKNNSERISQKILYEIETDKDYINSESALSEYNAEMNDIENTNGHIVQTTISHDDIEDNMYQGYKVDSILTIDKINISYPVLSETSEKLLKVSLNKYWGCRPNEVGNYCIVGHNYASGKMFGKLYNIEIGDIAELKDMSGRVIKYKIYDKYIVDPEDTSCTSQLTNGKKEITLITCANHGLERLIVKGTEYE